MRRARFVLPIVLPIEVVLLLLTAGSWWAETARSDDAGTGNGTKVQAPTSTEVKLTPAERILRLEQSIAANAKILTELKAKLEDPKGEYAQANAEFTRVNQRLKEREKGLATQPDGAASLDGLKKARELAKERFDLAIKVQESQRAKYQARERMLQQDRSALAELRGPTSQPATSQPVFVQPATGQPVVVQPASGAPATTVTPAPVAVQPSTTPPPSTPAEPTIKLPTLPTIIPTVPDAPSSPTSGKIGAPDSKPPPNQKEIEEAEKKARGKNAEAQKAETEAKSVNERIATLKEATETEQQLLDATRKQAQNAADSYANLRTHIQKLISTGAPTEKVSLAWARVDQAEKRSAEAEAEVNEHIAALDQMKSDLLELQSEQNAALAKLDEGRTGAAKAKAHLESLTNPFSLHNVLQWLIDHGVRLIGIIIGSLLLLWLTHVMENRIIRLIAVGRGGDGTFMEREARARTLASVFKNFASTAIIIGGILMILTEVSINIVPLLGGAAVFGLAVAFGAQSLIKDYFYGFMILLEHQYAINDVVKIGDASGVVERITLRMTVLRDVDGSAHFIPHGEIQKVTNTTHGWSRAVFDIGVGYGEDVDRVMGVLVDLARELRQDPRFSPHILDNAEMLGVDALGDSAVMIKFFIKTRPLQQLPVKREMLRRIKNRFDDLGIEIPFPHRTIYLRHEADGCCGGASDVVADDQITS